MATETNSLTDPVAFAEHVYGIDWTGELNLAPESYATVNRLMHELAQAAPVLAERETPAGQLWGELSDAVYRLADEMGLSGVRLGAACEHFRAAIVPPMRICPDCLNMFDPPRDRATCRTCDGTGVVAR
jgi:hypothetical protein